MAGPVVVFVESSAPWERPGVTNAIAERQRSRGTRLRFMGFKEQRNPVAYVPGAGTGSWDCCVLGSWFLVLGSWFLVLGSWFLVLGRSQDMVNTSGSGHG